METWIWAAPLLVGLAALRRPEGGVLALAAALPFFGSPPGGPYLAALDVAVLLAILPACRGRPAGPSGLRWPLVGLVAASLASLAPFAYHPPSWSPRVLAGLLAALPEAESWSLLYTWRALADLLLGLGLYLATRRLLGRRGIVPLGRALAWGLAAVTLLGLAELGGLLDLGFYRAIGLSIYRTRLHSLFFHSGWFAEFVVMALPLAVAALWISGGRSRALAWPLATLAAIAVLFSEQRGAWFALLAEVAFLVAVLRPRLPAHPKGRWALAATGLGGLALIGGVALLRPDRMAALGSRLGEAVTDLSGRTELWSAALRILFWRPLLGCGLGGFASAFDRFEARGPGFPFRNTAHSLYLHVGAERGVLGLIGFLLLAAAAATVLIAAWRRTTGERRLVVCALGATVVGTLVYGLVQYVLYLKSLQLLFWLLMASVSLVGNRDRTLQPLRRAGKLVFTLALLALPWRLFWAAPLTGSGDREYGLHEAEGGAAKPDRHRWTGRHAVLRLPWRGETLILPLENGHPLAARLPVEVTVRVDGRRLLATTLLDGRLLARLPLGAPTHPHLLLEIEAAPTFRPFTAFRDLSGVGPSADIRRLGVAVGPPRWGGDADREAPSG